MCTVTIRKNANYVFVTMNRDEAITRQPEKPPYLWDDPQIIAPVDGLAAGTWIGVREDGFWGCILNGYLEDKIGFIPDAQTRGNIIPHILSAADPLFALQDMDFTNTNSFRLLLGNDRVFYEYFWDQVRLEDIYGEREIEPYCAVSSSWKQDEVKRYRQKLYQSMTDQDLSAGDLPSFHAYQIEDMKEWTPLMQRSYAKTKSITQIALPLDTHNNKVQLYYWPADKIDQPALQVSF